jgi:hypothetical protein
MKKPLGDHHMVVKLFASVAAVAGAAVLTLATMLALVKGTIMAVSMGNPPLRILAVSADFVLGTLLLVLRPTSSLTKSRHSSRCREAT